MMKQNTATITKMMLYKQRIGYGLGDFACNLIWQVISLYLLYFYTDVMELNPMNISFMFIICRIIDGGTDLLVGFLIDKTHSRWGKSRPWFLFGAIPFALAAILAFSVPDIAPTGKLVYAYITYIFLSFMYTVVNIPLASILPALTSDMNERTVLTTYRKFFAFFGSTLVSATALTLVSMIGQGNEALGFRFVMGLFGVIGCICFFLTFLLVKENNLVQSEKTATLKETVKSLFQNKPWKLFALNILFMWTGYFLQSSALIYYYRYSLQKNEMAAVVATIMSIVPMFANLFVPFLSRQLGKRNLYSVTAFIQMAGLIVIMLSGTNDAMIIFGAIISAAGYGAKESIYFSMQADPVDYGEWKTGIQASGTLSSINGFLGKVAQAIAGGLSGLLLAIGGYVNGAAIQSTQTIISINAMYLYIPIILLICSMITMHFYTLDKELPSIQKDLKTRRLQMKE
ncbi:MFS transporter [Absiella sp. AM54-8XD]|uniref:MFS transporter n=2 Tax=Amedibacillus TaxID=2749846 RepID=A0A7G9GK36_9FIRM|nr:MFS transporter [[Eubacterium] hominis]RGB57086.1 MFS transporter [Absiella sp. AM10-20]RGB68063.1 MFS transporter [Absiella sp. AM09-45]RGB79280.1 MFS transporter [Absiella sp. AM09-50]RGC21059.1 MFS transporter [Absiella sp. AM54-8XD]RHU07569.1 MFS transporter [Absiella sp. AM27-20]